MIGLPIVKKAFCILGFIRFLKGYYLVLVTKRQRVAKILRHSIYTIKDIQLLPLFTSTSSQHREDENKYINYFQQVHISQGFYFSYTYDLTRSL